MRLTVLPILTPDEHSKPATYSWQLLDAQGRRKYVDQREFRHFLAAAKALPDKARLFCELVAYAGCRISEALNLRLHHIVDGDVAFRTLKQRGKIVFRVVPVPQWLTARLLALAPSGDLGARLWEVSRNTAYEWIIRAMRFAQIVGIQACPKGLRHGFGVRNVLAGIPLNLIQKWMGHADIKTTLIYLQLTGPDERHFAERTW